MKFKKIFVSAAIGFAGFFALAYWQFLKLLKNKISFRNVKAQNITFKNFNVDLLLNYENRSNIKFVVKSQQYKIFLNDAFITEIKNPKQSVILPESVNLITLNLRFIPKDALKIINKNFFDILFESQKIKIKVIGKLKIKLFFYTFSIPFVYEEKLSNLIAE